VLIGHHGVFSLTAIWMFAIPGVYWLSRGTPGLAPSSQPFPIKGERKERNNLAVLEAAVRSSPEPLTALAWLIGAVTVACLGFYLFFVPVTIRNYGGGTSGFRFTFWLIPLWLLALIPAADWMAERRARRIVGYILLGISIFSANYAIWNPWVHPWLTEVFLRMGWERF
jgi:hypothetical protein